MSGGSMNYLYSQIEYARFSTETPERRAGRRALPIGTDLVGGKWRWLG